MEGNERATHGLELLELFIGNNICCPFLLVVNQWQFMVEGPLYWGTIRCVDSSICKNRGIRNRLPGPQGTEILTPGTATRISLVVGQSQAWPCLGVAQKQKGRTLRGGRDDFRPAQQHLNSRGSIPCTGTFTDTRVQRSPGRAQRYLRCLFTSSSAYLGSRGCQPEAGA